MSGEPLLLGIDLGTSAVKVLLVDAQGGTVATATAEYPILHPRPEFAEQDPQAWWRATADAVRAVVASSGAPGRIAAIGLSGQMHGTVLLDGQGDLLAPAVIWPDQRSAAQVAEITALVGAERLYGIAGSPVATGFQAATVRWFQQEAPELWRRVRMILTPKDYLRWRLTGELASDPSDGAGALLLDVARRDWSDVLLELLAIRRDQLPPVQPSAQVAGQLTEAAVVELGLTPGIPVVAGAADTACSALGAGMVDEGRLLLTLSTGGQLIQPVESVRVDLQGRIHTFCSALEPAPGQAGWYQMGALLAAGLALRWLRDQVFGWRDEDAYARMNQAGEGSPPGANGLLFLPYLAGERTPHMDPTARAVFFGLTLQHGQGDLVRAVMEGVAFGAYDAYGVLRELGAQAETVILAGGGARSALWRQIVADVFGKPVQVLETVEQSARGAALLAGGGVGLFSTAAAARQWAAYGSVTEPDAGRHRFYQGRFADFRDLYARNRGHFVKIS